MRSSKDTKMYNMCRRMGLAYGEKRSSGTAGQHELAHHRPVLMLEWALDAESRSECTATKGNRHFHCTVGLISLKQSLAEVNVHKATEVQLTSVQIKGNITLYVDYLIKSESKFCGH